MPPDRSVHVVDDDADVRRSLQRLLHSAEFEPVVYDGAQGLLDAVSTLTSGCILVDVHMPVIDGLELQERLNELGVNLPVVVMTGHGDVQTAVRAMKAGAADFVEKPFDDERLISALEGALAGTVRRAPGIDALEAAGRIAALSRREREVLDALVAGHPNKVIARDLGISPRTVEVHRARMLERLGTASLAEAIRLAVLAPLAPMRPHLRKVQ
jgi:two-component system response regulator FixJ